MTVRKPIRRAHKKSRLGCRECKRRHVKCDEARPECANCVATSQTCVYQHAPPRRALPPTVPSPPASLPTPGSSINLTASDFASTPGAFCPRCHLTATSPVPASQASPISQSAFPIQHSTLWPPLNMRHMELFSHFLFETASSLTGKENLNYSLMRTVMPSVLAAPYVIQQMLAIAALHLSNIKPAQARQYREEATTLQTQALSNFNELLAEVTPENCAPMLIFTSYLGLHALAEAVIESKTDPGGFLDRFVTYSNLHRGVRAVTERSWDLLKQSPISSVLHRAERSFTATPSQSEDESTSVLDYLNDLLNDADMGAQSDKACRDAISHLKLVYRTLQDEQSTIQFWVWPVLLSSVFTDLLMKRKPEALIILGHYAVLLHRCRHIWFVGDAGRMLIDAITSFLGTYWKKWLDWPNEMLIVS